MFAGAWGRCLNKRKKPPVFREGKQVVLSIWVPGGIACKVTIDASNTYRFNNWDLMDKEAEWQM